MGVEFERFIVCCSMLYVERAWRSNVCVYESHATDGLLRRASTRTDSRHVATFCCDSGILLAPVSRFDSQTRRVLLWSACLCDLARGMPVDFPAQIVSRGFGRGEFVAPHAWLPSAAFQDYPQSSDERARATLKK